MMPSSWSDFECTDFPDASGDVALSMVRLRRLNADFQKLRDYARRHPRVELVQYDGDPPERYQLRYEIRSLRQRGDDILAVTDHLVEIILPRDYPRTPPQCRMLTPIFHPNIAPHAICIGDHWSPGETLESIVTRIGEMIAYQSYNTKSPLNGEAARWVDENTHRVPIDTVSMLPEDEQPSASMPTPMPPPPTPTLPPTLPPTPIAQPQTQPPPQPQPQPMAQPQAMAQPQPEKVRVACPGCQVFLRVPAELAGKKVRCPKCQTVIEIPQTAERV